MEKERTEKKSLKNEGRDDKMWGRVEYNPDTEEGSWEYMYEDDPETYEEGGLWGDGLTLTDYDGTPYLPYFIYYLLEELGIDTSECKD